MKLKKIGILPLIFFFLLLFYGGLIFAVDTMRERRDDAQAKLATLQGEIEELDKLAQQYQRIGQNFDKINSYLPANFAEFAAFIDGLSAIASFSGLKINIASQDQPEVEKSLTKEIKRATVNVELSGNFVELVDFFTRLYQMPYYTQIDELTISKEEEKIVAKAHLAVFMW